MPDDGLSSFHFSKCYPYYPIHGCINIQLSIGLCYYYTCACCYVMSLRRGMKMMKCKQHIHSN